MAIIVNEILRKYIDEELCIPRIKEELLISRAWKNIQMKGVSENSSFEKLVDGTMYINARNSSWAQQLNMLKAEIISKLNESVGQRIVKDIRTRTGLKEEENNVEIAKNEYTCPICGVKHFNRGLNCTVCERKTKQSSLTMVCRKVDSNSKLSFEEAREIMPGITIDDFRRIKRDMNSYKVSNLQRKGAESGSKKAGY
jgi:hypothetical protein